MTHFGLLTASRDSNTHIIYSAFNQKETHASIQIRYVWLLLLDHHTKRLMRMTERMVLAQWRTTGLLLTISWSGGIPDFLCGCQLMSLALAGTNARILLRKAYLDGPVGRLRARNKKCALRSRFAGLEAHQDREVPVPIRCLEVHSAINSTCGSNTEGLKLSAHQVAPNTSYRSHA